MRPIDGDAFKQQASVETIRQGLNAEKVVGLLKLIDAQPTIDAAPVVHARWADDMYFDEPVTRCTACKRGFAKGHKAERFPYCPNCGARMDADAPKGGNGNE